MKDSNTKQSISQIIGNSNHLFYSGKPEESIHFLDKTVKKSDNEPSHVNSLILHKMKLKTDAIMLFNSDFQSTVDELTILLEEYDNHSLEYATLADLTGLAHYYHQIKQKDKDFNKAKSYITESLQIREKLSDINGIAVSNFHLGLIYQFSNKIDLAREHFKISHNLAQDTDNEILLSFTNRHLAFLHAMNKEFDQALPLFKSSLELREKNSMKIYLPFSYQSLGDCFKNLNKSDLAIQSYQDGLKVAEEINLTRGQALIHLSLGILHEESDNKEDAIKHYQQAIESGQTINHEVVINYATEKLDNIKEEIR